MLVSAACSHLIIGHSERRQHFGETDETVNRKIGSALAHELIPVFCVGESNKKREAGETFSVLDKHIRKGLEGFSPNDLGSLVIAYLAFWAIGTGKTATNEQAQEVHRFIRLLIVDLFGDMLAKSVRILYGGSVKPDNVSALMYLSDVDGAVLGGAILDAESFRLIVRF